MPKQSLPPIAGYEAEILALVQQANPAVLTHSNRKLEQFQSAFACALHMHQPTIPAGANGERTFKSFSVMATLMFNGYGYPCKGQKRPGLLSLSRVGGVV